MTGARSCRDFTAVTERTEDESTLRAWLHGSLRPEIKPQRWRRLCQRLGSAAEILQVAQAMGADEAAMQAAVLAEPSGAVRDAVEAALAWQQQPEHHIVLYPDPAYPAALRELHDPPMVLYVRGNLSILRRPAVALVGSRHATAGGCELAQAWAEALASSGWCVVSGLALGIDAAAHRGALRAGPQGGGTLAVMATGADRVYPGRHLSLAKDIQQQGALLTELPLGTPSASFQFPRRNRLVAGLARGVVVIEAAARSGSLITARLANELGREVFAVPGSVHAPLAQGCHALIRQGAKLTDSVQDILEELLPSLGDAGPLLPALPATTGAVATHARPSHTGLGPVGPGCEPARSVDQLPTMAGVSAERLARVLSWMAHDPVTLDQLLLRSGWVSAELQPALLALELQGLIDRTASGGFVRRGGQARLRPEP